MAKRKANALNFETATTAAIVECSNFQFFDANTNYDSEFIGWQCLVKFNGTTGETGGWVSVARNASTAQKQTAVRNLVNSLLAVTEPAVGNLNNANIQITGLPV